MMNKGEEHLTDLFDEFYIIASDAKDILQKTNVDKHTSSNNNVEVEEKVETEPIANQHSPLTNAETEISIATPIGQPQLPPLNFTGANKQHIAFIYNDKIQDSKDNVEMIINFITKALKFSLDDVAILRLSKNNHHQITQILVELNAKKAVLWGCSDLLKEENIHLSAHQIETIGQATIVNAEEAQKYHNNQSLKLALWEASQKIFKQ